MRVEGSIRVPGDKSISHRALMLAALATGVTRIRDILPSADVHSTALVLRTLGAQVPPLGDDLAVAGSGARSLYAPSADLDCGNSGTTTRLVAGIAAALPFRSRFIGDASLSRRPMRRIAEPLREMGARVDLERGEGLPMVIEGGSLKGIRWETETASAQVKSAILLAGAAGRVPVVVCEPARSRDHTERMLRAAGVMVETTGTTVRLDPAESLAPLDLRVPADPSSAAFLCAVAALADEGELALPGVCVNPTRIGFVRALQRMGARLEIGPEESQAGEDVGTIHASPSALSGITVGGSDVPAMIDELPLLACVAARAAGTTTITGAQELRVKESDRISTVVSNLRSIGADAEELPDGLVISGSDRPLRGRVITHGDHRIAMAFAVIAALPGNEIVVDDPACVAVSYPGFWDDLRAVVR